ncbi:MAG: metallophosphoesterase [Deltaproteobacteria bacterium]|nr:metallophosphoesterase [Deltaproteobacteria bacterium]
MSKQVYKNNNKWGILARTMMMTTILSLVFSSLIFAAGGGRYEVDPWSFGVMADTQWTNSEDPEGANPEYVSAALARAIEDEFIDNGVKFVIQVGDLTDRAGDDGMAARAAAAQPLFDAGIGFFPLRGNHETYGYLYGRDTEYVVNIPGYKAAFPQTQNLSNTFGATNFSWPSSTDDLLKGLSYSFDYGDEGNNARFVIVDVEATYFKETKIEDEPIDDDYNPEKYGEAWYYLGWIVYKATATVPGGSVKEGAYYRISTSGTSPKPSTNFYGYEKTYPFETFIAKVKYDINGTEFWPGMQQEWISAQLDINTRGTEHAFVLSHRGLMGTNHADGFFGSSPASKPQTQIPFYKSLADNGVRYMLSGHDHLHNRALVTSPALDENNELIKGKPGDYQIQQIIHMAGSTKFYGPGSLDSFSYTKQRETQISQDLYNVGYYIYTIDGPRVNVDYYADSTGDFQDNDDYPHGQDVIDEETGEIIEANNPLYLPDLDFVKQESFGYSTNGKQFLIAQNGSYKVVKDSFGGTAAKILDGTNNSSTKDETPTVTGSIQAVDDNGNLLFDSKGEPIYVQEVDADGNPVVDNDGKPVYKQGIISAPRALNKLVNTGWIANPDDKSTPHRKHFWNRYWKNPWNKFWNKWYKNVVKNDLKSDIFSIWGMSEIGEADKTDNYVLSMTFDFNRMTLLGAGNIGIATYVNGKWKNAVNENFGGKKRFVLGPYKSKYGLGTYGIDPKTKTAWAVLNYNADFAVAGGINTVQFKR